jgi:hypothetical protein
MVVLKLKILDKNIYYKCRYCTTAVKGSSDVTKESKSGNVRDESTYA